MPDNKLSIRMEVISNKTGPRHITYPEQISRNKEGNRVMRIAFDCLPVRISNSKKEISLPGTPTLRDETASLIAGMQGMRLSESLNIPGL